MNKNGYRSIHHLSLTAKRSRRSIANDRERYANDTRTICERYANDMRTIASLYKEKIKNKETENRKINRIYVCYAFKQIVTTYEGDQKVMKKDTEVNIKKKQCRISKNEVQKNAENTIEKKNAQEN